MEAHILQIYWHESKPIYSLTFPTSSAYTSKNIHNDRLITCGGDKKIRVWKFNLKTKEVKDNPDIVLQTVDSIDFLSSLIGFEQAVNVIRFNNSTGDILASAGDDGMVLLWKLCVENEEKYQNNTILRSTDDDECKESWYIWKKLRAPHSSEIYDLCWSPDDKYIVVGCMDNTLKIFDVIQGTFVFQTTNEGHCHYVQGVYWDPQDQYIVSMSADRAMCVYKIIRSNECNNNNIKELKLQNKVIKAEIDHFMVSLFHNETLPSFFRRLKFSPCGSLLITPSGVMRQGTGNNNSSVNYINTVYIFGRSNFKTPIGCIPNLPKPAIAIAFNPNFYEHSSNITQSAIKLPYKLVFAVATVNQVFIYDSSDLACIASVANLHYSPITDICWNPSGNIIMISSTDGFISYITLNCDKLFGKKTFLNQFDLKSKGTTPENIPDTFLKKNEMVPAINILIPRKK
ncbi:Cac2p SCDLUD_001247 [Saccharomycodes ludwigii]|uniref:Cac2p n=1 Tax=Saccharomycodes ludwigii TaxID=36035 RepID=UPI001E81E158|nr:hypothetical protein SCDLUD_001247 [Saccharomycodes ludwigii]KAH3903603.1 hypothetical protein SCDLUD_001247 [Saccharomycodes ludwigii]